MMVAVTWPAGRCKPIAYTPDVELRERALEERADRQATDPRTRCADVEVCWEITDPRDTERSRGYWARRQAVERFRGLTRSLRGRAAGLRVAISDTYHVRGVRGEDAWWGEERV